MTATSAASEWTFPNPATPPGSSAYYSIRFAPRRLRDELAAMHGWRHLVRGAAERISDRGVAARQLGWWREELGRILTGQGTHPIARVLHRPLERLGALEQPLLEMITATETLLADRPVASLAELLARAELDLGALCELCARVGGEDDPGRLVAARRAGAYCGVVELIRDSGRLRRGGYRGFLPSGTGDGRTAGQTLVDSERLATIGAALAHELAPYRSALDMDPRRLSNTIRIRVRLADRLLAELVLDGFPVADQAVHLTPIHKLWHAWHESQRRGAPA
ncbi:MAG: hypothetical protein EOM91_07435 [Sphingobacteriia bacterium]|nr:hypothetical protein [Sphingobacteriia bacterium]NCC39410.1 hypothetical protein [Gammaproteobacteria bacterium]